MFTNIIVFSVITILIIIGYIQYFNKKVVCPNCKGTDIVRTGKRKYKEEPLLAIFGLQDSSNEIEYECKKCGNIFIKGIFLRKLY